MNGQGCDGSLRKKAISESGIDRLHQQRHFSSLFGLLGMLTLLGAVALFEPLPIWAQGQGNGLAAPSITSQPVSQTVIAGETATFSVTALGTPPPKYQWLENGRPIRGATSAFYTTAPTTSSDNGAQFSVVVSNKMGNLTSNTASLTVNSALVAPSITTQPASQTINAGQSATFAVALTGTSPLSYQWQENGTVIIGATDSYYTTPAMASSDNGAQFTVLVSNAAGGVTSTPATLTVNVPPTITMQPANQTVTAGQTATFSVIATGTAPLGYQWLKNGALISGATSSSYTTPATTTADSGSQFTVAVSNCAGAVTSSGATLTVDSSTVLLNPSTTRLSFGDVTIGSSSSLNITFTNAGISNITIANVSISGAGYTVTGISTGQILTPGQTATLNVTFSPSATGTLTGNVTVSSDATNSPSTISLTGSGVQAVSHSVTLSWSPSTSSVIGYNVYRSTVSGGSYTKLNSTVVGTSSYYDDYSLQAGQTYYYVVTSVDLSNVESSYSSQVSATVPSP